MIGDRASGDVAEPVAVLRAAGIPPAALKGASLADVSRSHDVTRVTLADGRGYVVKSVSPAAGAMRRTLAAELYAYRLASWRPELASAMPRVVHLDERRQVVVLEAASEGDLFAAWCVRPGFPSPALGAAMGRALAAIHRATTGLPLVSGANTGVVALPDTPEPDRHVGDDGPVVVGLVRRIAADPILAPALRRAAACLRPGCLIHGDLKWDNAVLAAGPPAAVLLFDWELSGLGDPAWDVGSAVADAVTLTARLRGVGALGPDPAGWIDPGSVALLAAYARAAPAIVADTPSFAERVRLAWVGRTVQLAIECGAAVGDGDDPSVADLLAIARAIATAPGLSESIGRIVSADAGAGTGADGGRALWTDAPPAIATTQPHEPAVPTAPAEAPPTSAAAASSRARPSLARRHRSRDAVARGRSR